MNGPYDDIINLPHHNSPAHPRMSLTNRAAQFSPFAALTGFESAIEETARHTDKRIELDENSLAALDRKLQLLAKQMSDLPEAAITFFQPDQKKAGGRYLTLVGVVKKVDNYEKSVVLMNGKKIMIADILDIECEMFGK